jgi:hypothetical protein
LKHSKPQQRLYTVARYLLQSLLLLLITCL